MQVSLPHGTVHHDMHELMRDSLLHQDVLLRARLDRYHDHPQRRVRVARDPVPAARRQGAAQVIDVPVQIEFHGLGSIHRQ